MTSLSVEDWILRHIIGAFMYYAIHSLLSMMNPKWDWMQKREIMKSICVVSICIGAFQLYLDKNQTQSVYSTYWSVLLTGGDISDTIQHYFILRKAVINLFVHHSISLILDYLISVNPISIINKQIFWFWFCTILKKISKLYRLFINTNIKHYAELNLLAESLWTVANGFCFIILLNICYIILRSPYNFSYFVCFMVLLLLALWFIFILTMIPKFSAMVYAYLFGSESVAWNEN
eukprot:191226_1